MQGKHVYILFENYYSSTIIELVNDTSLSQA